MERILAEKNFPSETEERPNGVESFKIEDPELLADIKTKGKFQATAVWNVIVSHLKNTVELKKHRVRLKSYNQCFSGADAVDVVFQYANEQKTNLGTKSVTRQQAAKICHVMVQLKVIESVQGSERTFEDSHLKLYRFVNESDEAINLFAVKNEKPNDDSADEDFASRDEDRIDVESFNGSIIANPTVSFGLAADLAQKDLLSFDKSEPVTYQKRFSIDFMHREAERSQWSSRKRSSLPGYYRRLSADFSKSSSPVKSSSDVEEEILQETALSVLLTIIDLPVLDGIANSRNPSCKNRRSSISQQSLIYSNFNLHHCSGSFSAENLCFSSESDTWLQAARDSLLAISGGQDVYLGVVGIDASAVEPQLSIQKKILFNEILDRYQLLGAVLWPECYSELQVELYRLVMMSCFDLALRALQLSLVVLNKDVREQIRRVLTFMKCSSDESHVRLSNETSNRTVVGSAFSLVIIKNRQLAPQQAELLVMFMMDHMDNIWEVPADVLEMTKAKLNASGKSIVEKTFCQRISRDEFCRQRVEQTEKSLVDLMNFIIDDTRMSLKEKQQRFKVFAKKHRKIYLKHFPDFV